MSMDTVEIGANVSAICSKPPAPYNHVKSSLLGSTSDSNINKYSTINKIPLIALNFSEGTDKKTHSPPTSETAIIAPKVKDRTHNVTEKVTQVSLTLFGVAYSEPYKPCWIV